MRIYYLHQYLFIKTAGHINVFSRKYPSSLQFRIAGVHQTLATMNNIIIWSRIEPCCSAIAACLPTLGPLVSGGRSPESLIHSIRSLFSTRSFSSLRGEKERKDSQEGASLSSGSSAEARRAWANSHRSGTTTVVSDEEKGFPRDSDGEKKANGIYVQQSFASEVQR